MDTTNKTKRISIRLSEGDYAYLVNKSADYDIPLAQIVRELIKQDKKRFESEDKSNG